VPISFRPLGTAFFIAFHMCKSLLETVPNVWGIFYYSHLYQTYDDRIRQRIEFSYNPIRFLLHPTSTMGPYRLGSFTRPNCKYSKHCTHCQGLSYVSLAIFWLYKLMDDHHIDKLTMLAWMTWAQNKERCCRDWLGGVTYCRPDSTDLITQCYSQRDIA